MKRMKEAFLPKLNAEIMFTQNHEELGEGGAVEREGKSSSGNSLTAGIGECNAANMFVQEVERKGGII